MKTTVALLTLLTLSASLAPAAAAPAAPNWSLTQYKDEMTGKYANLAHVRSSNVISLGWPYHGPQKGTLTVRKHPRWGTNVFFEIERGQLLCRYDNCNVTVKFDDAASKRMSAAKPEDNSSTYLFINNETSFINQLRKSKRVVIEVGLFKHGNQTLVFETSGFPNEIFPQVKAKKK